MSEIEELSVHAIGAVFRRSDLHVHTPKSADMDKKWHAAGPEEIVRLALEKGLDIIAITDHNTASFCDNVTAAAEGSGVSVFPGVEISTPQGHLIAIFEIGTTAEPIHALLFNAGISHDKIGTDQAVTAEDMDRVADRVERMGGIAIAAHVDNTDRGLMGMKMVGAIRKRVYECRQIRAFEIPNASRREVFQGAKMQGYSRRVPCIQSSDCRPGAGGLHQLDAIGARYSYLKMDEVSVRGLKQALLDPDMRIRLQGDEVRSPDRIIEGMWVTGGFLQGQAFRFNDDFTCLIGGTGVGKSLTIELLRYALDQQTQVAKIRGEVESLMGSALGDGGKVYVLIRRDGQRYLVEREYSSVLEEPPKVYALDEDGSQQPVENVDVPLLFPIKAYSQSEIIEFTREPHVRLSLVDDLIDLSQERQAIVKVKGELRTNAAQILEARAALANAREVLRERGAVEADVKQLEAALSDERIVRHRLWYAEEEVLHGAEQALDALHAEISTEFPDLAGPLVVQADGFSQTPNADLLDEVARIDQDVRKLLEETGKQAAEGITAAQGRLADTQKRWQVRFDQAEAKYQELLRQLDSTGLGLAALNERLQRLRTRQRELHRKHTDLETRLKPAMQRLYETRQELLAFLQEQRNVIRAKREAKAKELTQTLADKVRIRVTREADDRDYFQQLQEIKVGSQIYDETIQQIVKDTHPVALVNQLLAKQYDQLAQRTTVEARVFERLRQVTFEKQRLGDLFELQIVDVEDRIDVSLGLGGGVYKDLESLAHGQKCTVILSIAMAEGDSPLIADQPEDALHAEFIEYNIVSILRGRGGVRQYIFATRNANVLVSGDAEQVLILESDAQRGHIASTGSIDRLTTRDLILLNLEGGEKAFARRSQKYGLE